MTPERPDPDALLRRLATDERRARGRLKVFFGASPGVGKTYAMLESARARKREGVDVVVGWVETHGRSETAALLEGLERLAPVETDYRGIRIRELDLDAALARRPKLLILDELAHTNAPGSRHAKRWQDAQELLDAGIDVYTTLNVQHVESLNDSVNQVTGIAVRETVPDRVLDEADEVEVVDLPPEELLKRLDEGKVYVPEQAARATRQFFRRGNLLALRELALRRTADHVDADVQDYRRDHRIEPTWPVAERVLVCVRPNPDSQRLIRAGRRMAARRGGELIVAYVETPAQPALSPAEKQTLAGAMKLAEDLGAETVSLTGESLAEALLAYARPHNVSRIVVGRPVRRGWWSRLRGSLVDDLVRGSAGIEILVVPGGFGRPVAVAAPRPLTRWDRAGFAWAVAVVATSTLVCWLMLGRFGLANLVMVYLLGVAFVSARHGRAPSILAAFLSVAAFDFFFVPPYMTFAVSDTQYLVTFTVMLAVGVLISTLGVRVRLQAEAARSRERRTQVLFAMTRELARVRSTNEVAAAVSRHLSEVVLGPADVLLPDGNGQLPPRPEGERERAVAQWVFEHRRPAGLGTDTLPAAASLYVPLRGSQAVVGVLAVRPHASLLPLGPDQVDLVETFARLAGSALERVQLAGEAEQVRLAMEAERLRNTLLSSVSHDLRTPLAAITGAASSLLQPAPLDPEVEQGLKEAIYDEAERLERLVNNLLDMTRLESGTLRLRREWHVLEELVGAALARVARRRKDRPVEVSVPADLPLVPVDGVLVEQLFVNLLDNAFKYTEPDTPVRVLATAADNTVTVEVSDEGPGLPPGTEEQVFDKFYRGASGERGFGLGLPICRAIVTAHGGQIRAENRHPRGVAFRFTLPLGDQPPPAVEEARER
jgi:two-component system sensor histidine kinase KdpD